MLLGEPCGWLILFYVILFRFIFAFGSFLLLNSVLTYKYITDSLFSLLERDFWVVYYDLDDIDYLKLLKCALWPDMWSVFVMLRVGLEKKAIL